VPFSSCRELIPTSGESPPAAAVPASCHGPSGHDRSDEPPTASIRLRLSIVPIEVSIGMNFGDFGFHSRKSHAVNENDLRERKCSGPEKWEAQQGRGSNNHRLFVPQLSGKAD
jgi:hypothetical protein